MFSLPNNLESLQPLLEEAAVIANEWGSPVVCGEQFLAACTRITRVMVGARLVRQVLHEHSIMEEDLMLLARYVHRHNDEQDIVDVQQAITEIVIGPYLQGVMERAAREVGGGELGLTTYIAYRIITDRAIIWSATLPLSVITSLQQELKRKVDWVTKIFAGATGALDDDQDDKDKGKAKGPGGSGGGAAARPGAGRGGKALEQYTRDLTGLAAEGALDPVLCRDKEIERCIQILSRRTKCNPVLVGEPGVGKTAVVEGVAQRLANNEVPPSLLGKRIYALDLGLLLAGTMYRGDFEKRAQQILSELGDNILFIDEIHTVIGAGGTREAFGLEEILKPALARGELRMIGATTHDEWRKHIESSRAFARRLQPVFVEEPSVEATVKILRGIAPKYEEHHQVIYTQEALYAAAAWADEYITDRQLPDKAIDLIDEAAARVAQEHGEPQRDKYRKALEKKLANIKRRKDEMSARGELQAAASLSIEQARLRRALERGSQLPRDLWPRIGSEEIAKTIQFWTGVKPTQLALSRREEASLRALPEYLAEYVVGQEEAVDATARAVKRALVGFRDRRRPLASLLFLGPTGVGKTLLAKTLAETVFGADGLVRIDMSEFMEEHSVAKLIGAPPGYEGYEDPGQLTEPVRRRPRSVVLLDEIEKAHPAVWNVLLQILEDARLTDSHGRVVDFSQAIVIITSNIGSQDMVRKKLGFSASNEETSALDVEKTAKEALKRAMRPELINRFDEIVVFKPLSSDTLRTIARMELEQVVWRARDQLGIEVEIDGTLVDEVFRRSLRHPEFGARPVRAEARRLLEEPLADKILSLKAEEEVEELEESKQRTQPKRFVARFNKESGAVEIEHVSAHQKSPHANNKKNQQQKNSKRSEFRPEPLPT